ncbi:RNA polymerase sigma factor [Dactylosporangium sp. NPDC051541]|uniref:RNA polymerase sigma factor n=1 Tax=Dactylosporangium sp. NPDC051541 TaxID=3363977 RepID=UPI0037891CB0
MDPDPRDDARLLAATADGDRAAFGELYRRHLPWLLARLSRRCASPELVDEVVQDTFVAIWRSAGKWDGRGEPAAWIWGIGIRRLVDTLRRSHPPAGELIEFPGVETSAEEHVLLAVQYGDVGAALASLSPELRAVVQATVLDGLTTREAARLLGIPPGTVKTRMMRARAQLRERLT